MIVKFTINYGSYIGADDQYEIEVDDNATDDEIESAVYEEFLRLIEDNCSYSIDEKEIDDDEL